MTDTFLKEKRRMIMQSVRREGTKPELVVEKNFQSLGINFVKNCPDLPGRPDFVIPRKKTIVFVHGCFWHGHTRCAKGKNLSKSNQQYWQDKICRNRRRDAKNNRRLRAQGFSVYTVWECELKGNVLPERLLRKLINSNSCIV